MERRHGRSGMRATSRSSIRLFLHLVRSLWSCCFAWLNSGSAEIMLLGTGKRILQPPPFIRKYLNERGIQLDVLDTVSSTILPSFISHLPCPRETPVRPITSSPRKADASQPPSSPYPPARGRSPQSRRHTPTQNIRSSSNRRWLSLFGSDNTVKLRDWPTLWLSSVN